MLLLLLLISTVSAHLAGLWVDVDDNRLIFSESELVYSSRYNDIPLTGVAAVSGNSTAFVFSNDDVLWTGIYRMEVHDILYATVVQDGIESAVTFHKEHLPVTGTASTVTGMSTLLIMVAYLIN